MPGQASGGDRFTCYEDLPHGGSMPATVDSSSKVTFCRECASNALQNVTLAKPKVSGHCAAADQRAAKRQFVGELQVAAHWEAGRDPRHRQSGDVTQHPHQI